MKSIVLGFATADGKGAATVLAGPEVPVTEQVKQITGIKASGNYPDGIVRVEFCELVSRNVGIKIATQTPQTTVKKSMKKILSIIGAAALLLAANTVNAQTYAAQTLGTFLCADSTATNIAYVIDCRKQESVAVQVQYNAPAAFSNTCGFGFSRSVDGSKYSGVQVYTLPVFATTVSVVTNIPTQGAGYIKLNWFTNSDGGVTMTNTLKYAIKIP